jgi:trk system potassium uptake protein TrkH
MRGFERGLPIVVRDVSLLMHVPALMAAVTLPVCWLTGDETSPSGLAVAAAVALALGQLGYWLTRNGGATRMHHAMLTAAIAWLLIPAVGALPFLLQPTDGANDSVRELARPLHALFESFSGFTGTGLSVAPTTSELPTGLLWWRTLSQWVGGIGVIALMLTVLESKSGFYRLYYSEARSRKLLPTVSATARAIWKLFLLMSILAVLALWLAGLPWWHALNHGLTAVSTGGFSVTDDSFASYGRAPRLVAVAVMLAGAVSFGVYFRMIHDRDLREPLRDLQTRGVVAVTVVGAALFAWTSTASDGGVALFERTLFQWSSAVATAGLSVAPSDSDGTLALLLLVAGMSIGAAAGSTGGGMKQYRMWMIVQGVRWEVRRFLKLPDQVLAYHFDRNTVRADEANRMVARATLFVALWIGIAVVAGFVMLASLDPESGFGLDAVIFEAVSAQANVGLSAGITSHDMPTTVEVTLIAVMWIGRLEIIPILVLLRGLVHITDRGPAR